MTPLNPTTTATPTTPERVRELRVPGRLPGGVLSAREADRRLIAVAPKGFLDTTHFDTVRFSPRPESVAAFVEATKQGELAYSPYRGNEQVLEALATSVSEFLRVSVDPETEIIVTPGTQAGLFSALGSVVTSGSKVVLLNPEYLFSERILRFFGADIVPVRVLADSDNGPTPDLEALEREFRAGARVLVFSNPNNPTGSVYGADTVSRIAKLCGSYDVTVVVDELYSRLLHEPVRFEHLAAQPGMKNRTITLLGPSKTESLSGFRLGVVVAPSEIINRMEDIQSISSLRAPAYAQHVLTDWLTNDRDWLAGLLPQFTALRSMTAEYFARLPWLTWTPGEGTAYAWPNVGELKVPAYEVAEALLTQAGVLVSPGYQFGPGNDAHFRVCYARDETIWADALNRMVRVLEGLRTGRS